MSISLLSRRRQMMKAQGGTPPTPSYSATYINDKYINYEAQQMQTGFGFYCTTPISVEAGKEISWTCIGPSAAAVIATKVNETIYSRQVKGSSGLAVKTYTWTTDSDCEVVLSSKGIESNIATIDGVPVTLSEE